MKTETVKLSQIQVNGANPRTIKDDKFAKLVNSILTFPKMQIHNYTKGLGQARRTKTQTAIKAPKKDKKAFFIKKMSII